MQETVILISGFLLGFYMSWNIGANDVANSMATAVGAKAITVRQAIVLAGILNIVGAIFLGSHVTQTIRKGIVAPEVLADPHLALVGAVSALLAASLWISFATWRSLPVSTTHSIVGAMMGFGIMAAGFSVINWGTLAQVVASWIISPVFAMVLSYLMFKFIVLLVVSKEDPFERAILWSPLFIGIAMFVICLCFLFKTPFGASLSISTPMALLLAFALATIFGYLGKYLLVRYIPPTTAEGTEEIFRKIQIGTSCYVALAQGANDVANAIGPLALVYFLIKDGNVAAELPVPWFLLLFGGLGIAIGIAMAGERVIRTIGEKITTLTNTRGFSVDFAAATTVMVASKLGLPVSTTHAAVGGVLGVGFAGGVDAVNLSVVGKIILYWVLTVPAAALTSMLLFLILEPLI